MSLRHCSLLQVALRKELNVSRFYWDFTTTYAYPTYILTAV
jgi:hypothetical protein